MGKRASIPPGPATSDVAACDRCGHAMTAYLPNRFTGLATPACPVCTLQTTPVGRGPGPAPVKPALRRLGKALAAEGTTQGTGGRGQGSDDGDGTRSGFPVVPLPRTVVLRRTARQDLPVLPPAPPPPAAGPSLRAKLAARRRAEREAAS